MYKNEKNNVVSMRHYYDEDNIFTISQLAKFNYFFRKRQSYFSKPREIKKISPEQKNDTSKKQENKKQEQNQFKEKKNMFQKTIDKLRKKYK